MNTVFSFEIQNEIATVTLLCNWTLNLGCLEACYTGWSVCSGTINRGCPEAVCAVMTKSFNP